MAVAGCARRVARVPGKAPLVLRVWKTPKALQSLGYGMFEYYMTVPHLVEAFNAAHARIEIVPGEGPVSVGGSESVYSLESVGAIGIAPAVAQPLNRALRIANFPATLVPPEYLAAYRGSGALLGLPVSQMPLGVRWRTDVFGALGLPVPTAEWTIDAFVRVCQLVAAAIEGGRAQHLLAPLYPVGGTASSYGLMLNPVFWMAFVLGYGGSVAVDGQFAPDARAVQGLSVLVEIVRRYSPLRAKSPLPESFALAFDLYTPPGLFSPAQAFDSRWAWARLPRFPVRPVITSVVNGEGLTVPRRGQPQERGQLNLAVEALVWLYEPAAQALLEAWGAVPVLGGADVQRRFWNLQSADVQEMGGWANFTPYDAGWPGGGRRMVNSISYAMAGALSRAVYRRETLASSVAWAVRRVNG